MTKRSRLKNKAKRVASQDRWFAALPPTHHLRRKAVATSKAWAKANPEKTKLHAMRKYLVRKARKIAAPGTIPSTKQIEDLFASYSGLCVYCDQPATTVDHVEALAIGGSNAAGNLVPACKHCNFSKSKTPLLVWLARRRSA